MVANEIRQRSLGHPREEEATHDASRHRATRSIPPRPLWGRLGAGFARGSAPAN
jgi:hypothetical protein